MRRRVRVRVTTEGWIWLVIASVLSLTGVYKSINLVMLLGYAMFVVWLMNLILAGRRLQSLDVRLHYRQPIFAGTPFSYEVEIHNRSPKTCFGIEIITWSPIFVVRLDAFECLRRQKQHVIPRRGWYSFTRFQIKGGHPFGLVQRWRWLDGEYGMLVLPALGQLEVDRLQRFHQADFERQQSLPSIRRPVVATGDFQGLREFRDGDSPRWIHWRTSARQGNLMVREFESTSTNEMSVVLIPWLPETPSIEATTHLEQAVSLAATLCSTCCRPGGRRLMLAVAEECAPVIFDSIASPDCEFDYLECLALTQGGPKPNVDLLLDRLRSMVLPAGPIIVILSGFADGADRIRDELNLPCVILESARLADFDFYEPPAICQEEVVDEG
ncbi:MAG: membrane protein [Gemmatales bacterium]|nr:MAG: membrane protein [Gemmatales bacterium]